MNRNQGLLEIRPILIGVLLVCSYEAVTLWPAVTKYTRFADDPMRIVSLTVAIFITASVTYRSSFVADRVVFGAITLISVLTAIRMARLTSLGMLCVKTTEASMWTFAAVASLLALLRIFRKAQRKM